jgi:hypothetical protein
MYANFDYITPSFRSFIGVIFIYVTRTHTGPFPPSVLCNGKRRYQEHLDLLQNKVQYEETTRLTTTLG